MVENASACRPRRSIQEPEVSLAVVSACAAGSSTGSVAVACFLALGEHHRGLVLGRFDMLEMHRPFRDQAELHGIIGRVQALGLELAGIHGSPTELRCDQSFPPGEAASPAQG
jgi:hypothetical protein